MSEKRLTIKDIEGLTTNVCRFRKCLYGSVSKVDLEYLRFTKSGSVNVTTNYTPWRGSLRGHTGNREESSAAYYNIKCEGLKTLTVTFTSTSKDGASWKRNNAISVYFGRGGGYKHDWGEYGWDYNRPREAIRNIVRPVALSFGWGAIIREEYIKNIPYPQHKFYFE